MQTKNKTKMPIFCIVLLLLGMCVLAFSSCIFKSDVASEPSFSSNPSIVSAVSALSTTSSLESVGGIAVPQSTPQSSAVEKADDPQISAQEEILSQVETTRKVSQQETTSEPNATQSTSNFSPAPSIPDGKTVFAHPIRINAPKESDFGEWYDYALDIYRQFVTGTFQENRNYLFPYDAEIHPWDKQVKDFFNIFQEKCLTGLDIDVSYHQYLDNTTGEIKIRIQLDETSITRYQDIVYVQSTIQSIVGDAESERTVIDRITDWCIQNCRYDNDYQFAGEYRDTNTVVKNLLKTKKGICDDFAKLISYTCDLYGISCEYIASPNDGRLVAKRHAWNRICIDDTWYYTDVTWSVCAGYNAYPLTTVLWEDHEQYL